MLLVCIGCKFIEGMGKTTEMISGNESTGIPLSLDAGATRGEEHDAEAGVMEETGDETISVEVEGVEFRVGEGESVTMLS